LKRSLQYPGGYCLISFQRTYEELKHCGKEFETQLKESFQRTYEELKRIFAKSCPLSTAGFQRTYEELKR